MLKKISFSKMLDWFALVLSSFSLLILFLKGFLSFEAGSDFLWYHLPNGLLTFGISDFTPAPYIRLIIDTFPPLADYTQGFLVYVTGDPRSSCAANTLAFVVTILFMFVMYRQSMIWRWFFVSLLAVPMFVVQLPSGYVDFFGACGVLLAMAALVKLHERSDRLGSIFSPC